MDGGTEIEITMSAGIGKNLTEAEMALKYAKSNKTKKIVIYNESLPIVKEFENNINNYKLVKALTNMAKIFNLSIVAEFVENEKTAEILRKLDIDYFQGYYFSKPKNIEEI